MNPYRWASPVRIPLLAVTLVLVACNDDQAPSSPFVRPHAAATNTIDAAIDATDSYASADMSLETSMDIVSDAAFVDPATGDSTFSLTHTAPVERHSFETGFDQNGEVVAITRFEPDTSSDNPDEVVTMKLVRGVVTDYGRHGQPLVESNSEGEDPLQEIALTPSGSLVEALVLAPKFDPACLDGSGTNCSGSGGGGGGDRGDGDGGGKDDGGTIDPICDNGGSCIERDYAAARSPMTSTAGSARVTRHTATQLWFSTAVAAGTEELQAAPGNPSPKAEVHRKYNRTNGRWVLAEITAEREMGDARRKLKHRTTIRFSRVRFHENPAKDRARKQNRAARAAHAALPTIQLAAQPSAAEIPSLAAGSYACNPTTYSASSPNAFNGGTNFVLQHGIWSGPCTWSRMDPWLREDYKFNAWVRLQLPSTAEYDYQADSLARTMQRTNANNFILIGHSNGGIVSRRVAQRYPGLARGVITINSPHLGAPAVKYPLGTLSTGFQAITAPFVKMCEPVRKRGCGEIEMLRQAGPFPGLMIDPFGPVYRQMVPGNPFHTSLNSTPERFIRVGLVGKSWDKWRWSGMYADQKYGCLPEQKLEAHGCSGGIDHAWRTDRTFKHYKKSFVLHGLIAIGQALVGDFGKAGESAVKAVTKGGFVALMLVGDSMYDGYVSPGDDSDGIVPVKSQRYPSAERLYEIKDSDTHLGATKALRTRAKLKLALKDVFALDPYTTN